MSFISNNLNVILHYDGYVKKYEENVLVSNEVCLVNKEDYIVSSEVISIKFSFICILVYSTINNIRYFKSFLVKFKIKLIKFKNLSKRFTVLIFLQW